MPLHVCAGLTTIAGLAVFCSTFLVVAISRTRAGRADQRRATTPLTCGPAIEVPEMEAYELSPVLVAERTFTPGAEMFGLRRLEPSRVTGPRLLKPASVLLMLYAPVEKDAS